MNKKKPVIDIKKGEPEKPISSSEAKENFAALVDAYKIKNPVKYEMKKSALEAKLKSFN